MLYTAELPDWSTGDLRIVDLGEVGRRLLAIQLCKRA
jgi:hypothetical protein